MLIARQVMDVNAGGALFTAQAAGRQMVRFGNGGSIILIASICGSVALEVCCGASTNLGGAQVSLVHD